MDYTLDQIFENINYEVLRNANIMYLSYFDAKGNDILPIVSSVAEKKFEENKSIGTRDLKISSNMEKSNLDLVFNEISQNLAKRAIQRHKELFIDSQFLANDDVINFLKRENELHHIEEIKIIGNDYTLDEETYKKLDFLTNIKVKNSSVEADNIEIEPKKFVTNSGINEQKQEETDFFVTENMSDNEIKELIAAINQAENQTKKLNLRFYNPGQCVEFIEKLENNGLDESVEIDLLGYPLAENSDEYDKIISLSSKRKIGVTYTCCHDLLNNYSHEPFLVCNRYVSDLEPGGKTDLKTYTNILKFLEKFESQVKDINSTTEKVMEAYQYINKNYYYAADYKTLTPGEIGDVDKILERDEIVCVGFSNLLTIMCRRNNIPMFTYGAPEHQMNVARIVETNEKGEKVFDKICTFDPTNDCGRYVIKNGVKEKEELNDSYEYFGLSPEEWLYDDPPSFITLANTLCLSKKEREEYEFASYDPYMSNYFGGYTSSDFLYSMLHLMGYNYDSSTTNVGDLIATLNAEERIGQIPYESILEAATRIESKKHKDMNEDEFEQHMEEVYDRIQDSIDNRINRFVSFIPRFVITGTGAEKTAETYRADGNDYVHVDLDSIDVGPIKYQEELNNSNNKPGQEETTESQNTIEAEQELNPSYTTNDYIAGTTIRRPRYRNNTETDDEYIEYLSTYYGQYFPQAVEETNIIYNLKADEIIQDLPFDILEEQNYDTKGMREDEILESIKKINSTPPETDEDYTYQLLYNEIIQDQPITPRSQEGTNQEVENDYTYRLLYDEIIQDNPFDTDEEESHKGFTR